MISSFATEPQRLVPFDVRVFAVASLVVGIHRVDAGEAAGGAMCSGFDAINAKFQPRIVCSSIPWEEVLPVEGDFATGVAAGRRDVRYLFVAFALVA